MTNFGENAFELVNFLSYMEICLEKRTCQVTNSKITSFELTVFELKWFQVFEAKNSAFQLYSLESSGTLGVVAVEFRSENKGQLVTAIYNLLTES